MFKRYVFSEGLTNLIGSEGEYLINILGQVKDRDNNDLTVSNDKDGHKIVHCHGWDGVRDYRVIDLVAIQYKNIQIPQKLFNKVEAFVMDGDFNNTHASNVGYRFKNGPLEVEEHPGFYYVPGFTRIAIDKNGVALEVKTKCLKKYYVTKPDEKRNSKGGYFLITGIYFCSGVYVGSSRHRMLCLVFKDYPDNVDNMTVNHINGIPGSDDLDNLEWATQGENITHAYENNLNTKSTRFLVRDVLTGEITEYYSISECIRKFGYLSVEALRGRILESEFGRVFSDGKQFKLKSDERDWIIPKDPHKAIVNAQLRTAMKVRNCVTMEILTFPSQTDAAKATGLDRCLIKDRLITDNRKPLYGYQFQLASDPRPWLDFTYDEYLFSLNGSRYLVSARNLLTGEVEEFPSVRKASEYFQNFGIYRRLMAGDQMLLESGWQIKFKHDGWEDIPDFEEAIYKLKRNIMARCEKTGVLYIGNTSLELANVLRLNSSLVRKAALTRGNKVYNGYRFRLGVDSEPWPETVTAT